VNYERPRPTPAQLRERVEMWWTLQNSQQYSVLTDLRNHLLTIDSEIARRDREIAELKSQIAAMSAASPRVPHPGGQLE
jgi:hypothetical protein